MAIIISAAKNGPKPIFSSVLEIAGSRGQNYDTALSLPGHRSQFVRPAGAMEIRLTAQLIVSNTEALLAYSIPDNSRENGETHTAVLLQTTDAGITWTRVPLARTFVDRVRHWGFPAWPPEAIIQLTNEAFGIQFICRDEWIPFEPGGESLWQAVQLQNGKWTTTRMRYMDYEGADSPASLSAVVLQLPATIKDPKDNVVQELCRPGRDGPPCG